MLLACGSCVILPPLLILSTFVSSHLLRVVTPDLEGLVKAAVSVLVLPSIQFSLQLSVEVKRSLTVSLGLLNICLALISMIISFQITSLVLTYLVSNTFS